MNTSRTPSFEPHASSIAGPTINTKTGPLLYAKQTTLLSLLTNSVKSLFKTPPSTAMMLLSLALTLPAAILFLASGLHAAQENLAQTRHITLFLNPSISTSSARQLSTTLAGNKKINSATLTTTTIHAAEVLTIQLQPTANVRQDELDGIVNELGNHLSVDFVDSDNVWLGQNTQAIRTTKALTVFVGAAAMLLTILLVFTIIWLDLKRRKPETRVLNQMGISRSTLFKPILLRSLLLTLLAIGAGILLASGALRLLSGWDELAVFHPILPVSFSPQKTIWLTIAAILSCFLTVKLLSKKILLS